MAPLPVNSDVKGRTDRKALLQSVSCYDCYVLSLHTVAKLIR